MGSSHPFFPHIRQGTYAFIYFPESDQRARLDLTTLDSASVRAWWYDPRAGVGTLIGEIPTSAGVEMISPPYGPDWVLVLDDPAAHFAPPGLQKVAN